ANGLNVLASAKRDGVAIDVVNIMAMDYGSAVDNGGQMGLDAINAAIATEKQIGNLGLSSKLGITPMIGVNDIPTEVFTLADARALLAYAQSDPNVVRLAMWSVARDNGNSAAPTTPRQTAAESRRAPTTSPASSTSSIRSRPVVVEQRGW